MFETLEECAQSRAEDEDFSAMFRGQQKSPEMAYELTITLDETKPAIWRKVRLGDCTLNVLHEIIQVAMGWENAHLHMFEWGGIRFCPPSEDDDGEDNDETRVRLSDLANDGCKKLDYLYDFGDGWRHTIKIGRKLKPRPNDRFPVCLAGAGACPPEDCGGVWGYYELLEAIRDSQHARHDELKEWVGEYDPERFDVNEVNREFGEI
jgi:hypothetical protein